MEAKGGIGSYVRNPIVIGVVALLVGLILGVIYAWVISPVQWTGAWAKDLTDSQKAYYLQSAARDWRDQGANAQATTNAWKEICGGSADLKAFAEKTTQLTEAQRTNVVAMLTAVQAKEDADGNCAGGNKPGAAGDNTLLTVAGVCVAGLVILAIAVVVFLRYSSKRADTGTSGMLPIHQAGEITIEPAEWGKTTPPVASFTSKYIGTDVGYDDSFSIDTPTGQFLGECGVGVSETIGTGDPKKITALEVWLFDKNDIRTVTKVLMSEHAFYDDALRAKLAPKGEAILARVGETVLLETATLEISARVVELEYGTAPNLPPNSFFSKVTMELAAWAKENAAPAPAA